MDLMREKARKIMKDTKAGNQGRPKIVNENVKERRSVFHVGLCCSCCYCSKIFINSKYLMKHISRRHTDELMLIHEKLTTVTKDCPNESHLSNKAIVNVLDEHFDAIRKELDGVKQHVALSMQKNVCHTTDPSELTEKNIEDKSIGCDFIHKCEELDSNCNKRFEEITSKMSEIECFVKEVGDKIENLQAVVRENQLLKEDIQETFYTEKNQILNDQKTEFLNLKENFISELQHEYLQRLRENVSWEKKYPDLKIELNRLDLLTNSIKKKINSQNYLRELEQKLEKKLSFLIVNPDFQQGLKTSSRKLDNFKLTVPKISHNVKKDSVVPKQKHTVQNVPHKIQVDLNFLLEQKLLSLSISPLTTKITNAKFEKKSQLLNSERCLLSQKYKNFTEIYDKINSYADRKTVEKIKSKTSKEIKFLHTSKPHQSNIEQCNSTMCEQPIPHFVKKTDVIFKPILSDIGAAGDFKSQSFINPGNTDFGTNSNDNDISGAMSDILELPGSDVDCSNVSVSLSESKKRDLDNESLKSLSSMSDEDIPKSYFKPIPGYA